MGGIEVMLANSLSHVSKKYRFMLYALKGTKEKGNIFPPDMAEVVEGHPTTWKAYWLFFQFVRRHKKYIINIYNGGPITLLAARLAGGKHTFYHIHGTRYWTPGNKVDKIKFKTLWRLALLGSLKSVQVVANSHYSKKRFYEQVSTKPNIKVLYNGFDTKSLIFPKENKPDLFKIVVVGRLIYYKNLMRLIQESIPVFEQFPTCKIFFVGTGSFQKEMEQEIEKLGLEKHFVFLGYKKEYVEMYGNADLVLSVSYTESFGNTLVEGIISGTPVVASNIPAHQEVLADFPEAIIKLEGHIGEQLIEKISNIDFLLKKTLALKPAFEKRYALQAYAQNLEQILGLQ